MSAQFTISDFSGKQVNFENLDSLISPYNSRGELISGRITEIETMPSGKKIIIFGDIRIIDWEYSLGRLTRTGVMSKEYIRFVTTPAPGLKMTCIINKYGTITMLKFQRILPVALLSQSCAQRWGIGAKKTELA